MVQICLHTLARLMKNGQYDEVKQYLENTYVLPCGACGGMNRYSLRPNILPPRPPSASGDEMSLIISVPNKVTTQSIQVITRI